MFTRTLAAVVVALMFCAGEFAPAEDGARGAALSAKAEDALSTATTPYVKISNTRRFGGVWTMDAIFARPKLGVKQEIVFDLPRKVSEYYQTEDPNAIVFSEGRRILTGYVEVSTGEKSMRFGPGDRLSSTVNGEQGTEAFKVQDGAKWQFNFRAGRATFECHAQPESEAYAKMSVKEASAFRNKYLLLSLPTRKWGDRRLASLCIEFSKDFSGAFSGWHYEFPITVEGLSSVRTSPELLADWHCEGPRPMATRLGDQLGLREGYLCRREFSTVFHLLQTAGCSPLRQQLDMVPADQGAACYGG